MKLIWMLLFSVIGGCLNAQCDLNIGNNITICNGGTAYLGGTATLTGATGAITSYQWNILGGANVAATPTYLASPAATTSYVLTVQAPGCAATLDTVVVTVAAGACPTALFTMPAGPVCDETAVTITNNTVHVAGNTYFWIWGDGTTSNQQNPGSHTFNIPPGVGNQTVTVTLIVTNAAGRSDIIQHTIQIHEIPDPPLLSSNSLVQFNGLWFLKKCTNNPNANISISDNTPNLPWIQNYTINWGDATANWTSATEPSGLIHNYSVGTYTLTYTITGPTGCLSVNTYQVFVGSTPSIGLNGQQVDTCAAYTASYQISNVSNNVAGTYYEVTYNDGSPMVTYNHPPPASFTHTFTTTSCGNSSPNYANAYYCQIKAINPCGEGQATIEPIRISTPPVAAFTINPNPACVNSTVTVTNTGDPGDVVTINGCTSNYKVVWSITPATGWTLTSGTFGSTNSAPYAGWTAGTDQLGFTFTQAGTYQITQRIGNSFCGDNVITQTLCVVNPITADFTTTASGSCAPVTITTDNTSTGVAGCAAPVYQWSISPTAGFQTGNANSFEPTFLLTTDGVYTVTLSTTNACGTTTDNVQYTVVSPPTVAISAIVAGCAPYTVDPSAVYDNGGGILNTPSWTFQGGTPATYSGTDPGNVIFPTSGSPQISVTVSNQCATATNTISVQVSDAPQISVSDFTMCSGSNVTINNGNPVLTGGIGTPPYTYNWSGAGGSSSQSNPTINLSNSGTSPSVQTLTLIATDDVGCSSTDNIDVTVNPLPILNVTSTSPVNNANDGFEMCAGSPPVVLNVGADIPGTTFTWSPSGGLNGSTGPTVDANPGTSTQYTVTGYDATTGCYSSGYPVTISVNALPVVDAGNDLVLCSQGIPAILLAQTPTGGVWTDPSPLTGTLNTNDTYLPDAPGSIDTLLYTYTDAEGCINSDLLPISVLAPSLPVAGPDSNFCLNAIPYHLTMGMPFGGIWTGPGVTYGLPDTTFVPSSAGVGIHDLVYTIGLNTTCETHDTIQVEVYSIPTLVIPPDQETCHHDTISFVATASGGLYPYTWAWYPAFWALVSSSDSTVTMVPGNPGATNLYAPVTIEVTDSNHCLVSNWFELTVHPLPVITAGPDTSICFSPTVPYTLSGFSPATGGSWTTAPSNQGTLVGLNYTSGGLGVDSIFYHYTDALGCTNHDTLLINVGSPISINAGTGFHRCITDAAVLLPMPQPSNPPAQFNAYWTGSGISNVGTNYYFDPSTAGAGNFTLTYIYETGATCAASDTIHVIVGGLPVVNAGANAGVCGGDTISLSGSVQAGTGTSPFVYQWSPATGLSSTTILNPEYASVATGLAVPVIQSITLTVTDSYGCQVSDVVDVSVNPIPNVIAPDYSFCNQLIAETLTGATPAGGTWTSSNTTISSAGVFTPNGNGVFNVVYHYTDASGCSASDPSTITVSTPPVTSIGSNLEVCAQSGIITFTPSFVSVPATWTGSATAAGQFDPLVAGTYNIIFNTGTGSCRVSDTTEVLVDPLPIVNAGNNVSICNNAAPIVLSGQSPTTGGTGVWSGTGITNTATGAFDPTGMPIGNSWVYYQFTIAATGCVATDSLQVSMHGPSPISFGSTQLDYCFTSFINSLGLVTALPAGGVWTGNGVSSSGGGYVFVTPNIGTTNLTYTYTNGFGCVSDSIIPAVVIAPTYASANGGADIQFCHDADTTYTLQATPAGGSWVFPSWLNANGTFSGNLADTSIAVYTYGTFGCQTWDTITVQVHALPIVKAGPDRVDCINAACLQLDQFQPVNGNGLPPATGFWAGQGSISATGTYCPQLSPPGTNQLIYTYTQPVTGCVNRDTLLYLVHPMPQASLSLPAAFCHNAPYNLIQTSVGDTSFPGAFQSEWTVLDENLSTILSSTNASPAITFVDTGTYSIQLIITTATGCKDTIQATVLSVDPPTAEFTMSADTVCAPAPIVLTNISVGFAPSFTWSVTGVYSNNQPLPDTILLPMPVLHDTTYLVHVNVQNLCGADDYELPVFARVSPTPVFTVDAQTGCSPFVPVFSNLSYGQPDSFFWELGDGTTSTDTVPVGHGFIAQNNDTSVYATRLIVENGCRIDTMLLYITALPNTVTSFFNTDPPWGCAPLPVNFTNISAGATDYLWDFGDGSPLQTAEDISHTYTTGGNFTISLVAKDACSIDTSYANVLVYAAPDVAFTLDENVICLGTTLSINNLSTGSAAYSWTFGNGEDAVGFEPPYLYPAQGNFQIRLIGYSPVFGCPDTTYQQVQVDAVPQIDFLADPVQGCMPLHVTFTNSTQFSTSQEWDFGNGFTSTAFSPSTNYLGQGTYLATITAHNFNFAANLDCPAQAQVEIDVFPKPLSSFTLDANSACGPPASTGVQNQSSAGMAYIWTWENQTSMLFEPLLTFADTGMKQVSLVVSNEYSCSDTTQSYFEVIGQPVNDLRITPPAGCAPMDIEFESFTQYGDTWEWDFGDGTTGMGGPTTQHQYTEPGVYDITMRITSQDQCASDTLVTSAVVVYPNAHAEFTVSPDEIATSYPLAQFENMSTGANSFEFDMGDGSTYPDFINQHIYDITAESEFIITLIANNSFNCPDTVQHALKVAPAPSIYIPSSFTPNGDGKNDSFGPVLLETPKVFDFLIFDRWGHLVFETFNKDEKWDGTLYNNGKKPIKQDVYVYKVVLGFSLDEVKEIYGNVTVIY